MSAPYWDLGASITQLEAETLRERVSWAVRLGWAGVGLAHQAAAKLKEQQDRCAGLSSWPPPAASLAAAACLPATAPPHTLATHSPTPSTTVNLRCRCAIRPVELEALLAAAAGVREALAAAERRTAEGRRHGDPYAVRQLTRINIPADDPAVAQASGAWVVMCWAEG